MQSWLNLSINFHYTLFEKRSIVEPCTLRHHTHGRPLSDLLVTSRIDYQSSFKTRFFLLFPSFYGTAFQHTSHRVPFDSIRFHSVAFSCIRLHSVPFSLQRIKWRVFRISCKLPERQRENRKWLSCRHPLHSSIYSHFVAAFLLFSFTCSPVIATNASLTIQPTSRLTFEIIATSNGRPIQIKRNQST